MALSTHSMGLDVFSSRRDSGRIRVVVIVGVFEDSVRGSDGDY